MKLVHAILGAKVVVKEVEQEIFDEAKSSPFGSFHNPLYILFTPVVGLRI
jgi:hypothetical protein